MNPAGDVALTARVLASLLVVLALALLASRLARRVGLRAQGRGIRVVERVGLSREASVALVQVAGRGLLLGITAHRVSLLSELTDADLTDADLAQVPDQPSPPPPVRGSDGVTVRQLPDGAADALARLVPTGRAATTGRAGTGSVLDPRTWRQGIEALRDLTARRG